MSAEATTRAIERMALTKEWVLSELMAQVERCTGRRAVKKTVRDKATGIEREVETLIIDAPAANRALELLGNQLGMFIKRQEIGQPGEFELSADELRQRLIERARELGYDPALVEALL